MKHLRILLQNILFLLAITSPAIGQVNYQKIISIDGQQLIVSDMCATSDSGVVITCNAGYNSYAVRYSNSGNLVWSKKFASPDFTTRSVSPTSDGGFLISGEILAAPPTNYEAALIKLNSSGNIVFAKSTANGGLNRGEDAIQIPGTGYIMCATINVNTNPKAGLFRMSPSGNALWGKIYEDSTSSAISFTNVAAFNLNRIATTFRSRHTNISPYEIDGGIMMVDQNGNIVWNKIYQLPDWNDFSDISTTTDGGFIVSGFIDPIADGQNVRDLLLMKTDSLGNISWAKTYVRVNDDLGYSVIQTSDGGYLMAGTLYSNSSLSSCAIIKTDANGNILWSNQFFTQSTFPSGNIVVPSGNTGFNILTERQYSLLFDAYLIRIGTNGLGYCNDSTATFTSAPVTFQITSPIKFVSNQGIQNQTVTTSQPVVTEFVPCIPSALEDSYDASVSGVYPNPSSDGHFTLTHSQQPVSVTCTDLAGRKIPLEIKASDNSETRFTIAASGTFVLTLQFGDQRIVYHKLTVIR